VFKKLFKNSQAFGKKCQKTAGGIFLTHTVDVYIYLVAAHILSEFVK